MFGNFLTKIFGSRNQRLIKQYSKVVTKINALESDFEALSDDELKAKTEEFRGRIADGATLDSLLIEAFAVVREASKRTLGLRHFDVQFIGGMVLNDGNIAEMRTGEGKTLVATLPVYLNALSGEGVHVITVNDYLAARDANWMRPIYEFLGLTVGIILSGQDIDEKRASWPSSTSPVCFSSLGTRPFIFWYISLLSATAPEMISGVLASSIRIESTSSITAKFRARCTFSSVENAMLSRR